VLSVNVNEVDRLHQYEELFEVESCELIVGHILTEYLVYCLVTEFLNGAFSVLGGPFQFVPVQLSRDYLVFAHAHEHVVFVEDGNEREQVVGVLVHVAVPRMLSEHIVEHVLLVVTEVDLGQHHLLSAGLDFTDCDVVLVVCTHLPRYSRPTQKYVLVQV
jgi:hypothetical protein